MTIRTSRDTQKGNGASRAASEASLPDKLIQYAVPLISVIGAALYGVLRLAYMFFYIPVRASPDEVGYGYAQVLADELVGAIELVLAVALCLMPIATVCALLVSLHRRRLHSEEESSNSDRRRGAIHVLRKTALACVALAVPIVLIGLPAIAWLEGEGAAQGYAVRNVAIRGFIALPVLAVEAVPARVSWILPSGPGERGISSRQCMLYLGQANGTSVFYDVQTQESVRLPSADIIVTLQDTASVPIGC